MPEQDEQKRSAAVKAEVRTIQPLQQPETLNLKRLKKKRSRPTN